MDNSLLGMAGLPPEYQRQLETLQRKQALAQALQARGMNFQAPNQGRVASRASPFSALASVFTAGLGGYLADKAGQGAGDVRQKFTTDQLAEIQRLQGLPEADAINAGQTSQFPMAQQLAKTLYEAKNKRLGEMGTILSSGGQTQAALNAVQGQPFELAKPQTPQISFVKSPDGKDLPMVTNVDKYGIPNARLGSGGTTVNTNLDVRLPGKEADLAIGQIGQNLTERRTKAQAAKDLLSSTNFAVDALQSGAQAGGGEPTKQALRKGLEAVGIYLPETAGTEQLSQALLKGVVDNAKALRPASDTDVKILTQMAGSIGSDPLALAKTLAFAHAMAIKDLDAYNQYATANNKNMNPSIQSLFSGATSGYELPQQLTGPQAYQFQVLKNLQQQGMDISRFAGPDGKPMPANAQIHVDPTVGFPGIEGKQSIPGPASAPQFQEGAVYKDKNGNKAKYVNGQWVPQ